MAGFSLNSPIVCRKEFSPVIMQQVAVANRDQYVVVVVVVEVLMVVLICTEI